MNMRALVKVLILMTRIFLSLVLQSYHSLNFSNLDAFNFGLARAKNAGTKTMKYHFD